MADIQTQGKNFELLYGDFRKIVIGDENSLSFKPCATIFPFGSDSTGFSIRSATSKSISPTLQDGVIGWDDLANNLGVRFYDRNDIARFEGGALEYEVILYAAPASPTIPLEVEVSGLEFLYQPELSDSELKRNAFRPDGMLGGFSVYHGSKGVIHTVAGDGSRYKTGKAFDLPRPTAKDAKGNWIWGVWEYDGFASLQMRFDPAWLAAAIYPVIIGPTIGYSSIGASTDNTDNFALAIGYQTATAGDANPGTAFYGGFVGSGTVSVYIGAYVYNASGPFGQTRLGASSAITLTTGTGAFRSAAITWTGIAASTNYFITGWSNTSGVVTYYDAGSATGWFNETTAASPTNPFESAFPSKNGNFNNRASFYVDFTASGGGGSRALFRQDQMDGISRGGSFFGNPIG